MLVVNNAKLVYGWICFSLMITDDDFLLDMDTCRAHNLVAH